MKYQSALIVGAGSGLSASVARAFANAGMSVALAARSAAKLDEFVQATGAKAYNCDAAKRDEVDKLFADLDGAGATPDVVVYNASARARGPLHRARSGRGRPVDRDHRLCRLPGGAGGGQAHAATRPRRGAVHRRVGIR